MQEGDNFYDEEGISKDRDQNWLDSRRAFLAYVWKLYTDDIQDTLDATTREEIEANYRQITQELGKIERQIGGA